MPSYRNSHSLPYTAPQLYALVADVRSYPAFLPWCQEAVIHTQTASEMRADLVVGQGPLQGRFQSLVRFFPDSKIEVTYQEGPLKHLSTQWLFEPLMQGAREGGCRVDFFIDFSFQNGLLDSLMGGFVEKAAQRLTKAFESRAHSLYGKGEGGA